MDGHYPTGIKIHHKVSHFPKTQAVLFWQLLGNQILAWSNLFKIMQVMSYLKLNIEHVLIWHTPNEKFYNFLVCSIKSRFLIKIHQLLKHYICLQLVTRMYFTMLTGPLCSVPTIKWRQRVSQIWARIVLPNSHKSFVAWSENTYSTMFVFLDHEQPRSLLEHLIAIHGRLRVKHDKACIVMTRSVVLKKVLANAVAKKGVKKGVGRLFPLVPTPLHHWLLLKYFGPCHF